MNQNSESRIQNSEARVHAELFGPKGVGLAELTNLPAGRQGIAKAIEVLKESIVYSMTLFSSLSSFGSKVN